MERELLLSGIFGKVPISTPFFTKYENIMSPKSINSLGLTSGKVNGKGRRRSRCERRRIGLFGKTATKESIRLSTSANTLLEKPTFVFFVSSSVQDWDLRESAC